MARGTAAVALLFLVVLAGCGAVGGDGVTETLTPAPVSEPRGVDAAVAGDTTDVRLLLRAHADTAESTNYTVRVEQRILGPDRQPLRETVQYREVARGGERYWGYRRANVTVEALREFGTTDYWTNGTHVATRYDSPIQPVQTRLWASEDDPLATPSNSQRLGRLLRATALSVADRSGAGGAVLVGTRTGRVTGLDTPPNLDDPRNLTVRVRVRPSGLIDRWQVQYNATIAEEPVRVVRSGAITATGSTTVARPDWVANATGVVEREAPTSPYTQLSNAERPG